MTVLILLLLYFIPMIYNYKFVQKEYYHPEGKEYGGKPELYNYWAVFCPVYNILTFIFLGLPKSWKADRYVVKKDREWFKPKKPFN